MGGTCGRKRRRDSYLLYAKAKIPQDQHAQARASDRNTVASCKHGDDGCGLKRKQAKCRDYWPFSSWNSVAPLDARQQIDLTIHVKMHGL